MAVHVTFAAITGGIERGEQGTIIGPIVDELIVAHLPTSSQIGIAIRGWSHPLDPIKVQIRLWRPDGTPAPYDSPDMDDGWLIGPLDVTTRWIEGSYTLVIQFDTPGVWWFAVAVNGAEAVRLPFNVNEKSQAN